jgi:hypothetical protein
MLSSGDLRRRRHVAMPQAHLVPGGVPNADQAISAPSAQPERGSADSPAAGGSFLMFHPLITIAVSVTCSGQRVPISGQPLLA